MPLFNMVCTECYAEVERYFHYEEARECLPQCSCDGVLSPLPSWGRGLTYFEEGRGRWIHNMADQPVYVTSHWQHKELMKKHGVAEAPPRRGTPGCWA